jgi:hypothetical protein
MTAPSWLRTAMFATALMNFGAAVLFLPPSAPVRALAGFPAAAPAVYLATVALFIALFGAGYLWVAVTGHADPLFVGLSAVGKTGFVTLVLGFALADAVPWRAPLVASADLVFAALFVRWLATAVPGPGR